MKTLLAKLWQFLHLPTDLQLTVMRHVQDEFLIGVTGVILNDNNEILVCNHSYRDGVYWSLPGGYIKSKEHPREALAREIEEETGFIVRIEQELRIRTDRATARLDISLSGKHIGGEFKSNHEIKQAGFFRFEKLPLISQDQLTLIKEVLDKKVKPPVKQNDIEEESRWERLKRVWKIPVKSE